MRTSVLARSVIAAATLAVGSAALVATPATAATPSGITRETVIAAANGIRAAYASADDPTAATLKATRSIVGRGCAVDSDSGELLTQVQGIPVQAGAEADGLVAYGEIVNIVDGTGRECIVGAIASAAADRTLSGTATLTVYTDPGNVPSTFTTRLGADVTVTNPVSVTGSSSFGDEPLFSASGAATRTTRVPAVTVKDKKTKAEKKAAKKVYSKRLKALKKAYAKALDRAGSSKSKKAAAKKTYSAKKKAAKATYTYAIANYRIVKKARTVTDARPFTVSRLTF